MWLKRQSGSEALTWMKGVLTRFHRQAARRACACVCVCTRVYKRLLRCATYINTRVEVRFLSPIPLYILKPAWNERGWRLLNTWKTEGGSFSSLNALKLSCSPDLTHPAWKGCGRQPLFSPALTPFPAERLQFFSYKPGSKVLLCRCKSLTSFTVRLWYCSVCSAAYSGRAVWETTFLTSQDCKIFLNGIVSKFWFGNQEISVFRWKVRSLSWLLFSRRSEKSV